MREQKEINEAVKIFMDKEDITENINAIIDVLENDLDFEEIENKYHSEDNIWIEQSALTARDFLDGDIELEDVG